MNTLKDYVNWKLTHADKVAEAEGYPLTMENCKKNKRMKQLEIYGNSVQDGTPTPDNPIEVQSVGEKSVNLFDVNTYPLTNGYWINAISGLYVSNASYAATQDYIPCADLIGKTITISRTGGSNPGIAFYDENKTYISGKSNTSSANTKITTTVPENAVYYRFCVVADYKDTAQIQEGDTVTPFEPYGKYKIPVVQKGINYHDYKKFNYKEQTINGITFTPLGDGSFHLKGKLEDTTKIASYRVVIWNAIPVKAGTYHSNYINKDIDVMFGAYKKDSKFWLNITSSSNSGNATLSEDGYIGYCQIVISAGTTREIDDIVYPQLTKGTQNLPYEPYIEPITTNLFLNEPLRKVGDYADYIDGKGDKVVRNTSNKVFDGSENWVHETIMGGDNFYVKVSDGYPSQYSHLLCNMGKYYTNGDLVQLYSCTISTSYNFNFRYGDYNNLTDFKNKLAEMYNNNNPLSINYILKTPTEEPITLDLPKLNAKTTIIEVDTSLAPSNAKGKYFKR